jgi:hypothetical protein
MNAFTIPEKSCFHIETKSYPQLDYYHRAMANGTHPRLLRKQGVSVLSQSDAVALSNKVRAAKAKTATRANV